MSHSRPARCCSGVDLVQSEHLAPPPVSPFPTGGAAAGLGGGKTRVAMSGTARGGVRTDLADVFRRDYQRVVGVAARVLGSRDQAEDVAQEVFLSFGRSSVPAGRPAALVASPRHTPR